MSPTDNYYRDVLKRIILLDDECKKSTVYSQDNESILMIIGDIAKEARKLIKGKKEKFTFFWKGVFSQWYPSPFIVKRITYNYAEQCLMSEKGITYNCAEQYMMSEKAKLFGDDDAYRKIMSTNSPSKQQKYGREVENFDLHIWNSHCQKIVYDGNYAKFTQNPNLKAELLKTNGTIMVEASPIDRIWGIGLSETDPLALDRKTWKGKNWLGETLTLVRELIDLSQLESERKQYIERSFNLEL